MTRCECIETERMLLGALNSYHTPCIHALSKHHSIHKCLILWKGLRINDNLGETLLWHNGLGKYPFNLTTHFSLYTWKILVLVQKKPVVVCILFMCGIVEHFPVITIKYPVLYYFTQTSFYSILLNMPIVLIVYLLLVREMRYQLHLLLLLCCGWVKAI